MATKRTTPDATAPAIQITEAAGMPRRTRTTNTPPNPFIQPMTASWTGPVDADGNRRTFSFVVPNDPKEVKRLRDAIRNAASKIGCGAQSVVEDNGDRTVTIYFTASEKRARKPRKSADTETK